MCLLSWSWVSAQPDTLWLDLPTLLEVGGARNLTIQQYRQAEALADADLTRAQEWGWPELYTGVQSHQLQGAAMNGNGNFFLQTRQANLWAGLGLDASWQPGEDLYRARAARHEQAASRHQTEAQRNQVLLQLVHTYFDFLVAQQRSRAYEELIAQAASIAAQLQAQAEGGRGYASDALLAQSNRSRLQIARLSARQARLSAEARLLRLLNLPPGTRLLGRDTLLARVRLIPEQDWQAPPSPELYQQRPEYRYLKARLAALQAERKTTTVGLWWPELRLQAYGSYFGGLFQPVQPMSPAEFPNPQGLYPTSMLSLSLGWRIPMGRLVSGGRLAQFDVRVAQQELQQQQLAQQVNEAVQQARQQLRTAQQQLGLAQEATEMAQAATQQTLQRQQAGTVRVFEVFQAQEAYLQARLDYLDALAAYNQAQYSLYVAQGNLL